MQVLHDDALYKLYWHDDEQRILVWEVKSAWTWPDAYAMVRHVNTILTPCANPKYNVVRLLGDATIIPGSNHERLSHIAKLIQMDNCGEDMVVYVGEIATVEFFIKLVAQVYRLFGRTSKYVFTPTFEEALELIIMHHVSAS